MTVVFVEELEVIWHLNISRSSDFGTELTYVSDGPSEYAQSVLSESRESAIESMWLQPVARR